MRLWPWGGRRERGSENRTGAFTGTEDRNYTDTLTERLEDEAVRGKATATEIAATEAAAGWIGRCFAAAEVAGDRFGVVSRAVLELIGRELVRRGEMVFVIEGPPIRLIPAGNWNVHGIEDPETWRYRVDTFGPDSTRTRWEPGAGVVHARVNCDPRRPYEGRSALEVARSSAATAAAAERSSEAEARVPVNRIAPIPASDDDRKKYRAALKRGGIRVVSSQAAYTAGQQEQSRRWEPAAMQPAPAQGHVQLRRDSAHDVLAAFGIPPALFSDRADGTSRREAYRQVVFTLLEPWGRVVAEELSAKLDSTISLSFAGMHGADLSTRGRALKQLVDAGVPLAEALAIVGLDEAGD